MNLVDSSGWLEYFADAENADIFSKPINDSENLIVSVINVYEVYKKITTQRNEQIAKELTSVMMQVQIADIDSRISIEAARLSCQKKIPMADSLIYATAKIHNALLWTQDYDLKGLEGVKFVEKKK
ncbi:MAG: hypothetical protein HGGPFJEG_02465 [Ignavibacteria bacterium]|nr:hypothetical protein [Ignavibacteria bacterium]